MVSWKVGLIKQSHCFSDRVFLTELYIDKSNSIALTHLFLQGILILHNILINKIALGN